MVHIEFHGIARRADRGRTVTLAMSERSHFFERAGYPHDPRSNGDSALAKQGRPTDARGPQLRMKRRAPTNVDAYPLKPDATQADASTDGSALPTSGLCGVDQGAFRNPWHGKDAGEGQHDERRRGRPDKFSRHTHAHMVTTIERKRPEKWPVL